jgi:hypothetical protein
VTEKTSKPKAPSGGRRLRLPRHSGWIGAALAGAASVTVIIGFIWGPISPWKSCDAQEVAIGQVLVDKHRPFGEYLGRANFSARRLGRARLATPVDVIAAAIDVKGYREVVLEVSAYQVGPDGRDRPGSVRFRPIGDIHLNRCITTRRQVLAWVPALRGKATYVVYLYDSQRVELVHEPARA